MKPFNLIKKPTKVKLQNWKNRLIENLQAASERLDNAVCKWMQSIEAEGVTFEGVLVDLEVSSFAPGFGPLPRCYVFLLLHMNATFD